MHYLYIIGRSDGKIYVGVTTRPETRLREHIYNGNAHLKGRKDLEMCIIVSGSREYIYGLEPIFIKELGAELNEHPGGAFPRNRVSLPGERNGRAKFTEEQVIDIRESYANGESQDSIAQRYDRPKVTISKIVTGDTWKETGGPIAKSARGKRPDSLSEETKQQIKELREQGLSAPKVAKLLGVGTTTVYRYQGKI